MRCVKITVTGLVQGVGYRPFVAELAESCGIGGQVKNVGGIVKIVAAGKPEALECFVGRLRTEAPAGARVDEVRVSQASSKEEPFGDEDLPCGGDASPDQCAARGEDVLPGGKREGFRIVESSPGEEEVRLLPADLPVCPSCERELLDPNNRRFRYPFISCVACGPRFSILKAVPYDRDTITMGDFAMCPDCAAEYRQKGNIRRHAQTIACAACGPKLTLWERVSRENGVGNAKGSRASTAEGEEALQRTIRGILSGKIAAIKDIGGFHFAFLPTIPEPSRRLRIFKDRERKPFAVMFADVAAAREYCEISEQEEELLCSLARPIVLLKKKRDFCSEVCGGSDRMGVLLPCNPLQILLLSQTGPLVMTSGNRGGEPILIRDGDVKALMEEGCPDLMLTHDREIVTPLEDSIFQVADMGDGKSVPQILRRGRGIVPEPVFLPQALPAETFAAGGDLKAVFALGKGRAVYLSSHFGDLCDERSLEARAASVVHMERFFSIRPELSVGDLHPAYVSARDVRESVQHHHAHIASVMAEQGLSGPVLGVAFDGTGYGCDGTVWGSEFLVCEGKKMRRAGCFTPVRLPGGDAGAKNAAGVLLAFLLEGERRGLPGLEAEKSWLEMFCDRTGRRESETRLMIRAHEKGIQTVTSSSMGRLFDAVSALLGVGAYNSYEGECAIALEICASRAKRAWPLTMEVKNVGGLWQADSVKLIADIWQAFGAGASREELALGFHMAVAEAAAKICVRISEDGTVQTGSRILEYEPGKIRRVALSGGTFANRILLKNLWLLLEERGFSVYTNEKVPCGDGGLALGQMYLMTEDVRKEE